MYKRVMVVLFALSLVAMWRVEAEAGCSCIKYFGGSCLTSCGTVVAKGLLSTLSGIVTGGGTTDRELEVIGEGVCSTESSKEGECIDGTRGPISGVFTCRNNGGKFAVGANPTFFEIGNQGFTPVQNQVDKKGKFKNVSVVSMPIFSPAQSEVCHEFGGGQTWLLHDVAFCHSEGGTPTPFEVVGSLRLDDGNPATTTGPIDGQLRLVCNTVSCTDIQFNAKTGIFSSSSPYQCFVCPFNGVTLTWECADCGLPNSTSCQPFSAP